VSAIGNLSMICWPDVLREEENVAEKNRGEIVGFGGWQIGRVDFLLEFRKSSYFGKQASSLEFASVANQFKLFFLSQFAGNDDISSCLF
jgi:hypothetical protein